MTYSFLSNKYNENWIVNDDPCKEAMRIALGFDFGAVDKKLNNFSFRSSLF